MNVYFQTRKEIVEKDKCDLPCDEHRVGSKFHTLSSYECLRRPLENQFLTPQEFYDFIKNKFTDVSVEFVSEKEIINLYSKVLEDRFKFAKSIKGTLKFHSFTPIPGCDHSVIVKQYDLSSVSKKVLVKKNV